MAAKLSSNMLLYNALDANKSRTAINEKRNRGFEESKDESGRMSYQADSYLGESEQPIN